MKAIGINFNGFEWVWREYMKPGQTDLLKAKYSNRSFENALKRKKNLELLRLLDESSQDGEDNKGEEKHGKE